MSESDSEYDQRQRRSPRSQLYRQRVKVPPDPDCCCGSGSYCRVHQAYGMLRAAYVRKTVKGAIRRGSRKSPSE